MPVTIYYNPSCGQARTTLAMIRATGQEPEIIEYLKTPPTKNQLLKLIKDSGLSIHEAIRTKESLYSELNLGDANVTDEQLVDAMLAHPILMNRPFVVTERGTRLCRPADVLLEIMPEAKSIPRVE